MIGYIEGPRHITPDGCWLIRALGTAPKLTAHVQASSEARLELLRAELIGRREAAGVGLLNVRDWS